MQNKPEKISIQIYYENEIDRNEYLEKLKDLFGSVDNIDIQFVKWENDN